MSEIENTNPLEDPNAPTGDGNTPAEKKSKKKSIIIGILALLLILVAGYVYNNSGPSAEITKRIISLEEAKHRSDSLYNELKKELAIYKQENEELYAQLSRKEAELESQYSKIKRLIDRAERDKSAKKEIQDKLRDLGVELDNMSAYVESQTLDLDELRIENRRLKKEKEALDEQYAQELERRTKLEEEGHDLKSTNEELQRKLNTASVLQTSNIEAKGLRIKNNGEKKGINLAKRTELIEVCFKIVRNDVCPPGANRFFLRMIDPSGKVVKDVKRGSGKLTSFDTGQEIVYTTSKIFDYNTSSPDLCIEWFAYPNTPFQKGTYKIELYNKGRLVGNKNFTTK